MNGVKSSVWKQSSNGEWILFFNTENDDSIAKKQASSSFPGILPSLELKLGTLIMSPKGIGRLIKQDENRASVKLSKTQQEEIFKLDEISNFFPCYVKIFSQEISNWFRLNLPSNGTIEQLKKIMKDANIANFDDNIYILVANGMELKDEFSFEQLNFTNNYKVLVIKQKLQKFKVSRFCQNMMGWFSYSTDGIAFSSSKTIRLLGIGLYASYDGKTQTGTVKIYEDMNHNGDSLYEEFVEIPPVASQSQGVTQIMFKKAMLAHSNIFYSIYFYSNETCYLYYGSGGKRTVAGEKGIEFNFKCPEGLNYGTRVESGNFPEIYYSI